jgi:hypothetical protein
MDNIGLNVIEVNGTGAPAIAPAATSVAGFNVLTRRGIPNRPARITSMPEFVERFAPLRGRLRRLTHGQAFIMAARSHVNRIAGAATTVASRQLMDSGPAATLGSRPACTASPTRILGTISCRTTRRSVTTNRRLAETAAAVATTPAPLGAATNLRPRASRSSSPSTTPPRRPTSFHGAHLPIRRATRAEIVAAINAATSDLSPR